MSRQTKRQIFTMGQGSEMRTGEPGAGERIADRIGQTAGQVARDTGSRIGSRLGELGLGVIDQVGRRLEGVQLSNPFHIPHAYQPPVQEKDPPAYQVLNDGTLWVNDPDLAKQLISELNLAGIETPGGAFHLGMSVDGQTGLTLKAIEYPDGHEIEPLDAQVIGAIMPARTGRVERG